MLSRESSKAIERAAAKWAARLDRGSLTAADRRRLEAWSSADPRRQGALVRAMAILAAFPPGRGIAGDANAAVPARQARRPGGRLLGGGLLAASLVAGLVALVAQAPGRYVTRKGEFRAVTFNDGSSMWLDTDSVVRVSSGALGRRVEVVRGGALFQGGGPRSTPVTVRVRNVEVRGGEGRFAVCADSDEPTVEVVVQEGEAELVAGSARAGPRRLTSGAEAVIDASGRVDIAYLGPDHVERALAWRQGQLAFQAETLGHAAAAFARYSDQRIVLDDPALAALQVTGRFPARDPAAFARIAAGSLNLRIRRGPDGVHLTR
jgi:transmembrane sensor